MKLRKIIVATLIMVMALPATVALAATPVYEYGFDGDLGGAVAVTREGDLDGLPVTPNVPKANSSANVQYVEGKNGQAVSLDGTFGLVLDAKSVGETYSIAFWINPARFSNFGPLVQVGQDLLGEDGRCAWLNITKTDWVGDIAPVIWSRSEEASLELGDDPNLVWPWYQKAYFAADEANPIALAKNEWNHVVVTVDSTKVGMDPVLETEVAGTYHSKLYINGELFGEGPVAKYSFANDSKIYLGINAWDLIFKGYFDDFKVYDVALTDAEVKDAMNTAVVAGAAKAPVASTDAPKTGVASLGLVFGLSALAFGSGAVVLKKKED